MTAVGLSLLVPMLVACAMAGSSAVTRRREGLIALAGAVALLVLTVLVVLRDEPRLLVWSGGWEPRDGVAVGIAFAVDDIGAGLAAFVAALGVPALLIAVRVIRVEDSIFDALMLSVYIVAHGTISPGGGFQGGVIGSAALLLVYAAGQMLALERVRPVALVEIAEAVGAAAFVLVAAGGFVFAAVMMENFLPLAAEGSLPSGGMIPILNVAVGVEVAGAVTLILTELLDQALLRHAGADEA